MLAELSLLKLYAPLVGWVGLGWGWGYILPKPVPDALGKFLFWVGAPLSVAGFLQSANLSGAIWIAPLVAWIANLSGLGLAWSWQRWGVQLGGLAAKQPSPLAENYQPISKPTRGSFLLAAMLGNTGYLGYPVILALLGPAYFGWAVFYDLLGTMPGAYGLGVAIAARHSPTRSHTHSIRSALLKNPVLAGFTIGLLLRFINLPPLVQQGLKGAAWACITLSLVLIGMRLSRLRLGTNLRWSLVSLSIKMVGVPLLVGGLLTVLGLSGAPRLLLVLQSGMAPAFATLVIAEAYHLDRHLAVTTLALGTLALLVLLPVWIWLFPL